MATKKKLTSDDWTSLYAEYVLEHGESPKSVYTFAKSIKKEEKDFYDFFGSFEALESSVLTNLFDRTIALLASSEDYDHSDGRNKLLSFYFTFFENLTANRSFILYMLDRHKMANGLDHIKDLGKKFREYIDTLEIETIDLKNKNAAQFQTKAIREAAWAQFLTILRFWMKDTSPAFEKTDVFIEKSVNAGFDLVNVQPIRSVLDWGKFLFKEVNGVR